LAGDDKNTVLFLTHLYPRYERDFMAPFLATLIENLTPYYNMVVLSPRHETMVPRRNGVKLEYFRYFFKKLEDFSYTGNLYAKVRGLSLHYHILALFFFAGFFWKGFLTTAKYKPDIIHCSWFVPAGIIGYALSILFDIPLVITVHSDAFLVEKSKALRSLGRLILNRAETVIAVSNAVKRSIDPICSNARVIYSCNRVF
jgi:hypothetical protein